MMSSFPLVSFLITLLLAAAVCTHGNEPVKDTAGKPVLVGEQYFIQPVRTKSNNGGGLYPAAVNVNRLCPLGIAQSRVPDLQGLPVSFESPYGLITGPTVNTSVDVIIKFKDNWPVCKEFSKLWETDDSSSVSEEPAILVGGSRLSPNSQFKIEKAGAGGRVPIDSYRLTSLTGTVGTTSGISGVQLVLTNDDAKTLLVKFDKVDAHDAPSTSRVDKLGLRMFPFY